MRQDAEETSGVMNFLLSKGFAVDEELCTCVVTHANDTAASMHQKLKKTIADNWTNDAAFCYRAVIGQRAKKRNPNYLDGTNQQSLDKHLAPLEVIPPAAKKERRLRSSLAHLEEQLEGAIAKASRDVQFVDIFNKKKNRNKTGLPFKGIGREKCALLLTHGILSAKELLDCDGGSPAVLESWRDIVQAHCDHLERQVYMLRKRKEEAEEELKDELALQQTFGDPQPEDEDGMEEQPAVTKTKPKPSEIPPFSCLTDPTHCNARVISKSTVDRIKSSDCQRRKGIQLSKMRSLAGEVWKIDWGHKIAPKTKVHTGRGKPFAPFKSMVSIQNEDCLTLFWKCCPCSEGVDAMEADLRLLHKRHSLHNTMVKVVCVDNCCSVRPKLVRIVPGVLAKLDVFHWQERWNVMLVDLKSEKTMIFRSLMRRALFITEEEELNRVREDLTRRKKNPTPTAVCKAAKATTPPADMLERRVVGVTHALMEKDAEVDRLQTMGASNNEKRFFKPGAATLNTIVNQMEHVKKGCLSDPPSEIVSIHRCNQTTGMSHAARGTGGNEAAWRHINRLLDTPSIGISRAEQVVHNCFEGDNDRKRVSRLGEVAEETSRTEQLQALHGLATRCGFAKKDMPVPRDTFPSDIASLEEHTGFNCQLPKNFNVDDMREEAIDDDDDLAADGADELMEHLKDVDFDLPEEGTEQEAGVNGSDFGDNDVFGMDINVDLSLCDATIEKNETAFETFSRLTLTQPWVPFKDPKEISAFSDIDRAEMALFDDLQSNCDRNATISSARGCKTFAKAWNLHVSSLCSMKVAGDDSVVVVNRKSTVQMQEHCDRRTKQAKLRALSDKNKNDPLMRQLEKTFHDTRTELAPHQTTAYTQPVQCFPLLGAPQFGAPHALNTNTAMNAFQCDNSRTTVLCKATAQTPTPITLEVLGKSFKARTFCWRCGFKKAAHLRLNEPFGSDCRNNCGHEECSKCHMRVTFEFHNNGRTGPHCAKEPHPTKSQCENWGAELLETTEVGVV